MISVETNDGMTIRIYGNIKIMKHIRDIKLDLLMGNSNPILDLFNKITYDIQIINCDVYNEDGLEFIYFSENIDTNENEWIFYQDIKNKKFWCNYSNYWSLFENELSLAYEEIQSVTKFLVDEALKKEVVTPGFRYGSVGVDDALNRELNTDPKIIRTKLLSVEEALKREIAKFIEL